VYSQAVIPLRAEDFFTGIFAALAIRHRSRFRIDAPLYQGMQAAFDLLRTHADGLDIRFCLRLHPIYGDIELVRYSVADGVAAGVLRYLDPKFTEFEVAMTTDFATTLLASLPGGRALYEMLADEFSATGTHGVESSP
jgi:hypothetical protein